MLTPLIIPVINTLVTERMNVGVVSFASGLAIIISPPSVRASYGELALHTNSGPQRKRTPNS
jgi:hypothetical protein